MNKLYVLPYNRISLSLENIGKLVILLHIHLCLYVCMYLILTFKFLPS